MKARSSQFMAMSLSEGLRRGLLERQVEPLDELPMHQQTGVDLSGFQPLRPIGSEWELLYDPDRHFREYSFDTLELANIFIKESFEMRTESFALADIRLAVMPMGGTILCEAEVWNTYGELGENERLFTQALDELFDAVIGGEDVWL